MSRTPAGVGRAFLIENGFLLLMGVALFLAWRFPGAGGEQGMLPVDAIRKAGVCVVFFNQGVLLPAEALRRGLLDWRLHALIQGCTFVAFPLCMAPGVWALSVLGVSSDLLTGWLYLGVLPTTITSAVALTSVAGGNVPGALFNCSLSSVIGVFSVPLLCVAFLGADAAGGGGAGPLLANVILILLVPLVAGQLVRPRLQKLYHRFKPVVRRVNQTVILFMVWSAFRQSFSRGVWDRVSPLHLGIIAAGVVLVLFLFTGAVWRLSALAGLDRPSRVTALFCGSQKTLAVGLPMATLVFADTPVELGPLLVPLLIYHPAQLALGGLLAPRLRRGADAEPESRNFE